MEDYTPTCLEIAGRCAAGALSPEVALMEMLLATEDEHALGRVLAGLAHGPDASRHAALLRVHQENQAGCARLAGILRAEPVQGPARSQEESLAFCRQLFDGLVLQSEETSVALYSLGSPEILAAASAEIVALLQQYGLLGGSTRVLDVGCGIGRLAVALSPHVAEVEGINLSPQMVEAATRRCAALENVRIHGCSGTDFASTESGSRELVLAADSFPYVVQAGEPLVQAMFAEAARVLVPGGHFVLLNFSYRGELERDRADVTRLSAEHGFEVQVLGEQPFTLWNGAAFSLRRARAS